MNKSNLEYDYGIDSLKGLAIISVVIIHVIAGGFSYIDPRTILWSWSVIFDQIARFCVPLFIAVSGYSLSITFSENLSWWNFYQRRIFKLIPLYIFWSLVTYFLISHYGSWPNYSKDFPLLNSLIFGKADYHLYFIPLIFQLYFLFPLLYKLVRITKYKIVILAFVWQFIFYFYIRSQVESTKITVSLSDQDQYIFFGTWIFYFILGIYLNLYPQILKKFNLIYFFFSLVFLAVAVNNAQEIFQTHGNILLATRFTKESILVFATFVILFLLAMRHVVSFKKFNPLIYIGKNSFLIFLVHVMVLRAVNIYLLPNDGANIIIISLLTLTLSVLLAQLISYSGKILLVVTHRITKLYFPQY